MKSPPEADGAFTTDLFEVVPARLVVVDLEGLVIASNRAARDFELVISQASGFSTDLGQNYLSSIRTGNYMEPEAAVEAVSGLSKLLEGSSSRFDMVYRCDRPGTSRHFLMNAVTIAAPTRSVLISHTDVSSLKNAEAALHQASSDLAQQMKADATELDRFFSVAIDLLCILDSEGHFLRINPAVTSILGWTPEEIVNRPLFDFLHPDDRVTTRDRLRRNPGNAISMADNRYRHKDGFWRTIAWRSVKADDGLLYATGRDVTEQREFEEGLRVARDEAEKANAAKNEFLSRMSHELRTPMNAVLGYAQLLDLKYEDQDIKQATHAIMKGGKHLLELINEVLDLSRIESGNLGISIEPVDLHELVSQAMSLLRQASSTAGVEMSGGEECAGVYVQADKQRLLQVLLNVIGNAIKYNKPGGSVKVNCFDLNEDFYRVEISDTGSGIQQESQRLLFQPFQRFGDPGVDGTGLGLAVSERFVKLMGGNIGLSQSSPSGSTFFVELRKDQAPEHQVTHASDESSEEYPPVSHGRVLYIEDNISNINLVEAILEERGGVQLITAANGRLGLELAASHLPDLILLDVHLPDLMGDKVLELLKGNPVTQAIPVVMLSADVTPRQIKASLELGASEYLTKPLDVSHLFEILNKFLPSVD